MFNFTQKQYPTKTTVNLVIRERSKHSFSRIIPILAAVVLVVGLFCKFAVLDRFSAASRAEQEAAAAEGHLADLQASNAEYETVRVEYARYFSDELTGDIPAVADYMEVLQLIESKLMRNAGVSSATFSGNTLSVQLTDITLSRASEILADLHSSKLVESVQIYTADTDEKTSDQRATVAMTITLAAQGEEVEDES